MTTPDKEEMPTEDRTAVPAAYLIVGKTHSWLQWTPAVAEADASLVSVQPLYASLAVSNQQPTNGVQRLVWRLAGALEHIKSAISDDTRDGDFLDLLEFIRQRIDAALSTLHVNDRHHSGSDSYQAGASAPALSEKVNARSEWLPIESAPHGPNLILAFRNDAGKWRRVIGWHAKQFEIEVDADDLHSGLEEGPAGEAIYAKPGWYEYLDADEAPCNRIWPTHWMPLPSPPGAELNIWNEAERDGVSLKTDTSSQPASEAGKLSTKDHTDD